MESCMPQYSATGRYIEREKEKKKKKSVMMEEFSV